MEASKFVTILAEGLWADDDIHSLQTQMHD